MWVIMNNIVTLYLTPQPLLIFSHYWSFFDNFEADFLPRFSSEGDSSKTMHPLNPSSNLNNNTCNALGMCACDRTKV